MTSVSSSTSTSGSKGISGLVSGMDTDSMVESLTATTSNKIDKQNQQKQKYSWQQEAYRTVTTAMNEFVSKYFNSKSATCVTSTSFYSNYSSVASVDGYIKLSGSVERSANVTVKSVSQLATAASYKYTNNNLGNVLEIDADKLKNYTGWDSDGKTEISVYLDGVTKTITLEKSELLDENGDVKSNDDIKAYLNDKLAEQFKGNDGSPLVKTEEVGGKLRFVTTNASSTVAISAGGDVFGISKDYGSQVTVNNTLDSLGITASKTGDKGENIYTFSINGEEFEFTGDTTLSSVIKKVNSGNTGVNMSFSAISKTFSITSTSTGANQKIELDGDLATGLLGKGTGAAVSTAGTNMQAVITVDGIETVVERSGNSMTFDGMTMEFTKTYTESEAISFKVDNDTDGIVEKIQQFIDDYNALVSNIYSMVTEKPDSKYAPLTDAQKEEMSETEIKNWETKAKQGLLYNDSALTSFLSTLRSTMMGSVDGSLLAKFGINTVNTTNGGKNNGTLEVNKDTLKNALLNNTTELLNLFTKNDSGIVYSQTVSATASEASKARANRTARKEGSGLMQRLSDLLQDMVYTGTPKGKLLQIAGMSGDRTDTDNQLYKKMKTIDSTVEDLKDKLETERTRYYNKFTAMETALSKLNSTSSYIDSMLGTNQ